MDGRFRVFLKPSTGIKLERLRPQVRVPSHQVWAVNSSGTLGTNVPFGNVSSFTAYLVSLGTDG